jgi:hypothetical protein
MKKLLLQLSSLRAHWIVSYPRTLNSVALAATLLFASISAPILAAPNSFVQQQQLIAADGAAFDQYGSAVAISGDTAVVGAPYDTVGANYHQGSVYVFVRSGSTWTQQAQLFASDGAATDEFGWSVAIDGETIVVGADADDVYANTDQGSAYVFTRSGTVWTEQAHLFANDGSGTDRDFFGVSVAVKGDTAIVGAYLDDYLSNVNQGSAYVFVRSGTTWSLQQHLLAADGAAVDEFGSSVALDGETAVVGAWSKTVGSNVQQGSAYVFVRSGTLWTQQAKLTSTDGQAQDFFGASVGLSGDTVIIGADWHDVSGRTNQGAAYIFVRNGTVWSQQQQLTALDGAANDEFGHSVAVSGNTVAVGAWRHDVSGTLDQGTTYSFSRSGTVWNQDQQFSAADSLGGDQFGTAVALSGNTLVVGAWADDVAGKTDQGSVAVFTQPATPTMHVANLVPGYQPQGTANRVYAEVTVQDSTGIALSGATVTMDLTLPNNRHKTLQAVTNKRGMGRPALKSALHGSFTFCVTNITASGYTYDATQNSETCDSVVVP